MKKFISVFVATTLLLMNINLAVLADSDFIFTYTINGDEATITGVSEIPSDATEIVVPSFVSDGTDEYKVTAIAADAFNDNTSLRGTLFLPATLESIGNNAFRGCTGIDTVIVEEGAEVALGTGAFQNANGIKYVSFPAGTDISESNNIFNNAIKGTNTLIEFAEGITALPYQAFRQGDGLTNLVLPSTMSDIRLAAFFINQYLEELYVLSEEVNFSGSDSFDSSVNSNTSVGLNPVTGTKGMGNQTAEGSTKIYVVNDDVKQALMDKGWPLENRIEVMDYKTAFFYDSYNQPLKVADEDADGYITLPEPRGRDGYKFLCWNIGGLKYFPGEDFNITKSIVVTGKWIKDTEEKTILYKNVSVNQQSNEFEDAQVGRIICSELANKEVSLTFIDSNDETILKKAVFDSDGKWINFDDNAIYKKVVMPDGYDYSELYILVKAEDNFKTEIALRKSQIIAMPKIDGVDNLSDFIWNSSNINAVSVSNGVITGISSGISTITVSNGITSFSFEVEALGEMAMYIKDGKESEYLKDKENVFSAINSAIKNNNATNLKTVFTSTGNASLSHVKDFDTAMLPADEAGLTSLAQRLITYGEFDFSTTDKVLEFIQILMQEVAVGKVNLIDDIAVIEAILAENNHYYNLPLENEYYLKHKDEVLSDFVNYTAKNANGLKEDFKESYVMTAVKTAAKDAGYTVLRSIIGGCEEEIGYNKKHYKDINTSSFHKQLLINVKNGSIETLADLKKYIDTSKAVEPEGPGGGIGGGSGGGSAGGSGGVSVPSGTSSDFSSFLTDNDYNEKTEIKLPEDKSSVFSDVETDRWSYQSIQYLVAKKIISGYEDGSFKPQNKITRAEFIRLVSVAFGLEYAQTEAENIFADVKEDDWFYRDLVAAYNNKIVYGDDYGYFNPDAEITRQEIAAMLYRAIVAKGVELETVTSVNIADRGDIDDWAYTPVYRLVGMNIVSGYEDGTFRPANKATREEVAKLIYNVAIKLENIKGAE